MKVNRKGICIRVVAALLVAVLFMSLCPVIPSASAAAATYTVTFDANGGTFPGYYTDGKNPAYTLDGSTLKIKVNAGEQTVFPFVEKKGRTGYFAYDGWGETKAKMGAKTPIINSDITFKAFWGQEGDSRTVSVRVADGSGNNIEFNMPKKGELYVPENPYPPSTTKKFDYWEITITTMFGKEETFKKEIGTEGDEIPLGSFPEHVLIMARWKDLTTQFLVLYHYNPPAGYEVPKDVVNEPYRSTSTNINDVNKQEKGDYYCSFTPLVGYESLGWSTDSGATVADPEYAPGSNVTLTENLDLYVVWAKTDYSCELNCQYYIDGETFDTGTETVNLPAHMPYEDILTYKPELVSGEYGGHHYTLTAVETSGTVEKGTNNITLRYEYDELNDAGDSKTGGDNIPDKFQRLVTYKIQNGKWSDGTEDDKIEVVTLKDGDDYSTIGTATLENVPEGKRTDTKYSETGVWSTGNGKKPEKVGSLDNATFTLTFLEADKAIKIIPSSSPEIPYDGEKHTFNVFEAYDINGDKLETVEVTVNGTLPDEFYGTSAGQTVDIQSWLSENGKTWSDYFTVTVHGKEISLSDNAVIFQTGDLGIVPKPLDVTITLPETSTFTYCSDPYTVSASYSFGESIVTGDTVTLLTEKGGPLSVTATYVKKDAKGNVIASNTLPLDKNHLSLAGEKAKNYSIDSVTVSGSDTSELSIIIKPRGVNYYTFGGTWVYNVTHPEYGKEFPENSTDTNYGYIPRVNPWYENLYADVAKTNQGDTGFIFRHEAPGNPERNNNPKVKEARTEDNAGIYPYTVDIKNFMDTDDETLQQEAGYNSDRQHFDDYAVTYHLGYLRIFPQSIDPTNDKKLENTVFTSADVYQWNEEKMKDFFDTYDTNKDGAVTYDEIEAAADEETRKEYLPDYYVGVTVSEPPETVYSSAGKWIPIVINTRYTGDGFSEAGSDTLVEDTHYKVTYQRQVGGKWETTSDFTTPGKIQVTITGLAPNYCDSVTRTYTIVAAPDPDPGPDPTPGPDVEIDNRDHYAYIIGKPDGTVDPNGKITRAEIATIIFRLLKEDVREEYWSKTNSFPDVEITDWYNNAISTLENLGIVEGKGDGLYHPEDPITRAEMATMMARLYDYDVNTGDFHTKFDDIDPDAWYARYVAAAEDLGLFVGDGATDHFYPERSLSRAEAMTVYNRLLGRKPHNDGLLPEEQMILWPDNMDTAVWYYADVQEATNSHTCDMDGVEVDDKHYELWLEPLPVRDWAALERAWSEAYSGYDGHDVN